VTWVKLCGMRSPDDVAAAEKAGADAVGFVIAPGSPRMVTLDDVAAAAAGASIATYLVAVDLTPDALLEVASMTGVDGVQPHGSGSAEAAVLALSEGFRVLFPVAVSEKADLSEVPAGAMALLDTAVPGLHGGSGKQFDWESAAGLGDEFVLAGGLTSDTVAEAIRVVGPWGVDVSSGIERQRGVKDPDLMRQFVEAVRGQ